MKLRELRHRTATADVLYVDFSEGVLLAGCCLPTDYMSPNYDEVNLD
ncbi:MAG: hypothetical protein HYX67_06635 [Candidatus Melainabacteria bacterium]|nr:hypothetical protein [Candidatus Melainabacteria bacterium]